MSNKLIILLLIQFIFSSDTIQFDQKRLDNIDSLSNKLIKEKKFTGVSVYINSSDKVIYNKQIGYGNVEKTIQLDESTNYRIFSMTKPITSVALMILLERGLLSPGELLFDGRQRWFAKVRADGSLISNNSKGSIHSVGAEVQGLTSCNGWTFWHTKFNGNIVSIDTLRNVVRNQNFQQMI